LPLAVALGFRGGIAARAVWPGLAAGFVALALPLFIRVFGHACFGPACMSLCLPACALGGAISGVAVGVRARHESAPLAFIAPAMLVAGLTGAMGCSLGGTFGILGMIGGLVAGGAPLLLAARR
jgi:hypothetical protein